MLAHEPICCLDCVYAPWRAATSTAGVAGAGGEVCSGVGVSASGDGCGCSIESIGADYSSRAMTNVKNATKTPPGTLLRARSGLRAPPREWNVATTGGVLVTVRGG